MTFTHSDVATHRAAHHRRRGSRIRRRSGSTRPRSSRRHSKSERSERSEQSEQSEQRRRMDRSASRHSARPPARKHRKKRPCICVYDMDQTLTSARGCPGAVESEVDRNYWLSPAAQNLRSTDCGKCFSAIVSAGGPRPIVAMVDLPRGSRPDVEPLALWNVPAHQKGDVIPGILGYYRKHAGVRIPPSGVNFYDDYRVALESVKDKQPESAVHQVSCRSRSGRRGLCGADVDEITTRRRDSYCS